MGEGTVVISLYLAEDHTRPLGPDGDATLLTERRPAAVTGPVSIEPACIEASSAWIAPLSTPVSVFLIRATGQGGGERP